VLLAAIFVAFDTAVFRIDWARDDLSFCDELSREDDDDTVDDDEADDVTEFVDDAVDDLIDFDFNDAPPLFKTFCLNISPLIWPSWASLIFIRGVSPDRRSKIMITPEEVPPATLTPSFMKDSDTNGTVVLICFIILRSSMS